MTSSTLSGAQRNDPTVPEQIGKYVVVKRVGRGSSGTVYLSHDPFYGRDVAIKLYHNDGSNAEDQRVVRKMFFTEASMVGMLQHPNILPIYDAGEHEGNYYVVMEHVHGARTLSAYCKPDNLLRIDDVVEIVFKCAKALYYAHSRGVVHRDIKPSNIMLTQDSDVRIIDFGIALNPNAETSAIEGIAGSPSYMSPEQVRSSEITNRSDLYSLGVVTYELLTGKRPFRANNLAKLLHQIVYSTAPPIYTVRSDVPEILETAVATALQKDASKRFQSGLELAASLTRVNQHLTEREGELKITMQQRFDLLRRLRFFHDFSHGEIWEVLRASDWRDYGASEEIVREGEMDDRFYIIVSGEVEVRRAERVVGRLSKGDCFGETSYVKDARRTATISAAEPVTLMRVSSTLLEQVSAACQLRFMRMFLHTLIERLQSNDRGPPAN